MEILLIIIPLGVAAFFAIKYFFAYRYLKEKMEDSLIVFGKKGHGKTLTFSVMARIWAKKHKGYLSTSPLLQKGEVAIKLKDVSVSPNTYREFLEGNITKIKRIPDYEGKAVFIDDAGIYLPNFMDSELKKAYPSLPIAYALYRHMYNAPIFVNSQAVGRTYKLIKEQADGFLKARSVRRIGPIAFIKLTYFSNIRSAENDIAPMGRGLFNKFQKANQAEYTATNGEIRDFTIPIICRHHKYDSRYFKGVLFEKEPEIKRGMIVPLNEKN